jgi:predicted acetyltransferase
MQYQIETIHEKDLTQQRRNQLAQWFKDEFGYIPLKWAEPQWYILAFNDSELIGRVGIIDRLVLVADKQIRVGGISGVIAKNERRNNGVGKALMAESVKAIKDKLNASFGLLLCRKEVFGFYDKLGWKVNDFPTTFEQPQGKMVFPNLTMTYSCDSDFWPNGPVDLNGLPW